MHKICFILIFIIPFTGKGQNDSLFRVTDINVEGNQRTESNAIIILSGLKIEDWVRVPGPKVNKAIRNLWETGNFKSIEITRARSEHGIDLTIHVEEYFLLGDIIYEGLSKSEISSLNKNKAIKELQFYSPNTLKIIERSIENLLYDKGYVNNKLIYNEIKTNDNVVSFNVKVDKGSRYKIDEVIFDGVLPEKEKLVKILKENRPRYLFFKPIKIYHGQPQKDIRCLVDYLHNHGYPYAEVETSLVSFVKDLAVVSYQIKNTEIYHFGKFQWEGNEHFSDSILNLQVTSLIGELYNEESLESSLYYNEKLRDISSLYYEDGFASARLSYQLIPSENQEMNVLVKIHEGNEMTIGRVKVEGNVRTKEYVLLRELLTHPGDVFSRSAVMLSQQKLMQMDYFIPEEMDVKMEEDTITNQVHLTYMVTEKISDKLLLSGGFDGYNLVGTLGFDFKNFAGKDVFRKGTRWNPLPAGGGQHLSLKGQTDGRGYYGTSFSFYEPWLKGKPIGFSISSSFANIKDSTGYLNVFNGDISFSKPIGNRFSWLNYGLNYKRYNAYDYDVFGESYGHFNALSLQLGFLKNTTDNAFFPTKGEYVKVTGMTSLPPFSRFNNAEAQNLTTRQKFEWFEYYKLKLSYRYYQSLNSESSLVLASSVGIGYLGHFNNQIGTVPFQRFMMGGTGMTNYSITTNDFIRLRAYENGELSSADGDPFAMKYTLELRKMMLQYNNYSLSGHLFTEGGNTFTALNQFDLQQLSYSFGTGVKLYAPIVGVVGLDLGWKFGQGNFDFKAPSLQFTLGLNIGDF